MADGDDITDVERLVEFWHSSGGDIARNKDLADIAAEVFKELDVIKILREIAGDDADSVVARLAKSYLDDLDRA